MIYGKDVALEYPTKDLYDSNIMLQAINAARYDYQTGQDQIKEFNKLYGDFISPIQSDVDYWNQTTIKPVRDALNAMYQQGIDPTRSAEGRALIAQIINNVPTAELNKRRASAKNAEEYLKNRAALQRAGKYNPDYEQFTLGGKSLETWNTDVDGPWMRTSPMEYQTLHDFVDPTLDNVKPYELSKEELEDEFGRKYDPRYQYVGIAPSRLKKSLVTNLPGLAANPLYDFYKEQAKQDWMREHPGQTPTEEQILDRFVNNALIADYERVVNPVSDADKYAMLDYKHQQDMQKEAYKAANAMARARVAASARVASSKNRAQGGLPDLFEEAQMNYITGSPSTGYDLGLTHGHRIVPMKSGIKYNAKDHSYEVAAGTGNSGVFFAKSEIQRTSGKPRPINITAGGKKANYETTFWPDGNIEYRPDTRIGKDGKVEIVKPRWFISGTLSATHRQNKLKYQDGSDVFYMEVKQGANNYNQLKNKDYNTYYPDDYELIDYEDE